MLAMPSGLHLFLGPDRARKLQRLHELERALRVQPLDRHHVDGSDVSAASLLALCRQQPAESPLRLIAVDDANRLEAAAVDALLKKGGGIGKGACVVLLVEAELGARHPLARALSEGGASGPTGRPPELRSDRSGARPGGELAIEEFPARSSPAAKPFALTESLGRRDAGAALSAVRDQLMGGREPLELLGLVAWQLQRWVVVRRLLDAGQPCERIAAITRMQPWQVERVRSEISRRTLPSLQDLLERCWKLDVDAKSGRAVPELALEQVVLEVCVTSPLSGAGGRSGTYSGGAAPGGWRAFWGGRRGGLAPPP